MINKNLMSKADLRTIAKSIENRPKTQVETVSETVARLEASLSNLYTAMQPIMAAAVKLANAFEKAEYDKFVFKQTILSLWNKLEVELNSQNRYFPKSDFIPTFEGYAKEANYVLRKGSVLYRARKIEVNERPEIIEKVNNIAMASMNTYDYQRSLKTNVDVWEYIDHIDPQVWEKDYINRLSLQNVAFWGFSAEKSGAPLENATQGRVNPAGVSYLYTARDANTAISEIQPSIAQLVSVAKIKTNRRLKVFDFDFHNAFKDSELMQISLTEFRKRMGVSFWELEIFFDTMSELFSKPALGNASNYYATQYISEFIKHLGFDGIGIKVH
jgi:hypothetical protein